MMWQIFFSLLKAKQPIIRRRHLHGICVLSQEKKEILFFPAAVVSLYTEDTAIETLFNLEGRAREGDAGKPRLAFAHPWLVTVCQCDFSLYPLFLKALLIFSRSPSLNLAMTEQKARHTG